MKKRVLIMGLLISLIIPSNIFALSASASCSGPSSVELGETFTVTITGSATGPTYWSGQSINSSGNLSSNSGTGIFAENDSSTSVSKTYSFTANSIGTATVNQILNYSDEDYNEQSVTSSSCTINIVEATRPNGVSANILDATNNSSNRNDNEEVDPDKSSNNNLKSLSVDGFKINPTFNKDKLEYTLVVNGDKDKINIKGEVEDNKSTADGFGEKELKEGINKFEIKVTAENGTTKTYIITVTRKEKNPIEVTIDKKKYTISKKDIGLKVPDGFTKTTVVINKEEVVGYSNSFTGYLIVALVDEDGNAGWFIYNQENGTYNKYSEFKSNGLRLIILNAKKKDVPYNYKKYKIEINGSIVEGYALEYGSDYRLVYALNMDTGDRGFYLYDMKDNTFQRFYNNQANIYRDLLKKVEMVLIGLGAVILIMFIIIVSQVFVNKKTKKFIKSGGKVEEEPELRDEEEEEEEREELKNKIKEKSEEIDNRKIELAKTKRIPKPIKEEIKEEINNIPDSDDTLSIPLNIIDEKYANKDKKNIDREFKTDTFNIPLNEKEEDVVEKEEEEVPLTREEVRRRKKKEKEELEAMRRDFFDL